jgi:glycerol-3-phosphate acyltransferase PlsY
MSIHLRRKVVAAVVGYLAGSVSFTRIAARIVAPEADIRETALDVPMSTSHYLYRGISVSSLRGRAGVRTRLAVVALDMAKGAVPTLAFRIAYPDDDAYLVAGTATVVGHNWPLYHGFVGGTGSSPLLGALLVVDPRGFAVTVPLGLIPGYFLKDFGFTVLLPFWFLLVRRDPSKAAFGSATAALYWYAKLRRSVMIDDAADAPAGAPAGEAGGNAAAAAGAAP